MNTLLFAVLAVARLAFAYQEAPVLAERVARGELPPVAERLPIEPVVVEPVESIGVYGGTWRRVTMGIYDIQLAWRLGYEPLVRWDRTATKVVPGLAKSWEILDEGRTFVFHLRPGLKWSDGVPLTSDDFRFTFEDVFLNREITPIFHPWLTLGSDQASFEAPDPLTVVYRFTRPNALFLERIAFYGNMLVAPRHYLEQFHARYADAAELERKVRERGVEKWYQLYALKADLSQEPDLPSCRPFVLKVAPPATRIIAERNPYYWKVDPAGNQLPYIDRIAYTDIQNAEIATFKAMAGEVDFQSRRIDPANYPLFMENAERGGYHVLRDLSPDPNVVYLNQHSKDPELRGLLKDRRFRVALSVAVNRPEIIDVFYSGMAVPSRGIASPYDHYYLPEFDSKYLEYNPDEANRLLDEVGLKRGWDGMRRLPSGRPFRQILNVFQSETGSSLNLWQLVADYWREVGLDFVVRQDAPDLARLQVINGNSDFWAYCQEGMHWALDAMWYVPLQSTSYFAPLYGRYYNTKGKKGVKPPQEYQQLVDRYDQLQVTMDETRRLELGHQILGQWAEECYVVGINRPEMIAIVKNNFRNVPEHIIHSYMVMTPGYIGIEQFYLDPGEAAR